MTPLHTLLQNHIEYNGWATERLLNAANSLTPEQRAHDFGTADHSVFGTCLHLYRSERAWLQRVQHGKALHDHKLPQDESWQAVSECWLQLQADWRAWVAAFTPSDPDRIVQYEDWKQQRWSQPVWQILLHVVNHSTHHRGQVMGFLRALGTAPPPLDFIFYIRQKEQQK